MNILLVRNILNTIFIVGAAVGMIVYWKSSQPVGTYIIIGSMAFKFAEVCIRMMKIDKDDE